MDCSDFITSQSSIQLCTSRAMVEHIWLRCEREVRTAAVACDGLYSQAYRLHQILKYTWANLRYFIEYVADIRTVPLASIKFLDEARFESRDLMPVYGRGVRGKRIKLRDAAASITESYTVTLCISTVGTPLTVCNVHAGTNSAVDFVATLTHLRSINFLTPGDVLVVDNAPIHECARTRAALLFVLRAAGVRLLLQPRYSPELNACEDVFADVKNDMRRRLLAGAPFLSEVFSAFARVPRAHVLAYYYRALYRLTD